MIHIHHIALWTHQLEELRAFYTDYFNGISNEKYINHSKGFESYFISFGNESKLEIMRRTNISKQRTADDSVGLTHIAFAFDSKEDVLKITEQVRQQGFTIAGEPRTSGDGYFESVILDPDGNRVECVYKGN